MTWEWVGALSGAVPGPMGTAPGVDRAEDGSTGSAPVAGWEHDSVNAVLGTSFEETVARVAAYLTARVAQFGPEHFWAWVDVIHSFIDDAGDYHVLRLEDLRVVVDRLALEQQLYEVSSS